VDRRKIALGGMWVLALAGVGALYWTVERGGGDARRRETDGAPTFDAEDEPLGEERAASSPMAPIPEGPPLETRGDRRHTGRTSVAGPSTATVRYRFDTHGNIAGAAVVDAAGNAYVGSLDHHVYAIGADGRERWNRDLGGPVYVTPALDPAENRLYVGADSDFFFCLDATTGEVIWHLRTEGDVDTGIAFAPDGSLIFAAGEDVWSVGRDGTPRWRFHARIKIYSAPAIDDDGTVYVGAQDDFFYAIAPDGRLRWRVEIHDDVDSSPVIGDDGTIYFGSDNREVQALDRNGRELWRADVGGYVRAPLSLGRRGDVLVPVFGPTPRLVSLDARTGEERWSFSVDAGASSDLGVGTAPLVDVDGNIYFGADDGFIYAISADGALRWVHHTEDRVDSDPVLGLDGTLYVGSDDDHLYAIR
jgi:outer membrane protein assembly factor BamB